jgi:glycosyltransferase involved in cell wall biosynthesis
LVSAVIPTHGRPGLLVSAVHSALRQTWPHLEVIVVVDGTDPQTEFTLAALADPRLRVVVLPECLGGSCARNAGVRAARGDWIAFLDDDDEWLPEKIERQMRVVWQMPDWFPVVSCRLIAQSPSASRVLPVRSYEPSQPLADYLFARTGFSDPGGLMQTSTLLAPRELLLAIPFRDGLPMHQDWDWLLRVASHRGVSISMLAQPLSIWRVEDARSTVGRSRDWRLSLDWIRHVRRLISPRAFSWFIAVQCAWRAQRSRAGLLSRLRLLRAFLFEGRPEWRSFLHFLVFNFVPPGLRRPIRNRIGKDSGRIETASGLHLVFTRKPAPPVLRKTSH